MICKLSLVIALLSAAPAQAPVVANPYFRTTAVATTSRSRTPVQTHVKLRAQADEEKRGRRWANTGKWVITDGRRIWLCKKTFVEFSPEHYAWRFSDDDYNMWLIPLSPNVRAVKLGPQEDFDTFLRKNRQLLIVEPKPIPETRIESAPVPTE